MSAAVETSTRIRISDPKPDHCSMCFRGPQADVTFYDCGAAFDAGAVINTETQAYVTGSDDLHICESCVRELVEASAFKPELHTRQFREIKRLELGVEHWRSAEQRQRQENERLRKRIVELEADMVGRRRPRR